MSGQRSQSLFRVDVEKYLAGSSGWSSAKQLLFDRDFHCVACYRYGQMVDRFRARHRAAGLLPVVTHRVWKRWTSTIHHLNIAQTAMIGPGFYIMHRNGVEIGGAVIGENCVIHQNVTIGEGVACGDHSVPQIGNNVWIGPGATLAGGIKVGNDVTIAAGAVLSKSVPDRVLVAGNPARVVRWDYDNTEIMNAQATDETVR